MLSKIIAGVTTMLVATGAIAWEGGHWDAWLRTMAGLVRALCQVGLLG